MDSSVKPHLQLPVEWRKHLTYWNKTLCRMLIDSELFTVTEDLSPFPPLGGVRNCNFHLLRINGKLIGVDTWDTWDPTAAYFAKGHFKDFPMDLLIKIQYYPCEFWEKFTAETKIPVKPWTIFPASEFPLGYFQWKPGPKSFVGALTGRNNRFGRQRWMDWCRKQNDFHVQAENGVKIPAEQFLGLLKECTWGISLKGKHRNHDGKNRRECEYASCGVPLALNYIPHYPFAMTPNIDFVYIKEPEDLYALRTIDPAPFALASSRLYESHFSPKGMSRTLLGLISSLPVMQ